MTEPLTPEAVAKDNARAAWWTVVLPKSKRTPNAAFDAGWEARARASLLYPELSRADAERIKALKEALRDITAAFSIAHRLQGLNPEVSASIRRAREALNPTQERPA